MKTIFLAVLLALALALSGCVGPGDDQKREMGNASLELIYIQGFDLLDSRGGHELSRFDSVAGNYSHEVCPDNGFPEYRTVPLYLSDSEKEMVYNSFVRNRIWEIDHEFTENCRPDNGSYPDRICQSMTPGSYSILEVAWKGQSKKIAWTIDYINSTDDEPQLARYKNFEEDLQKVIENKIAGMGVDLPGCMYM
jgi:hypothetical protein